MSLPRALVLAGHGRYADQWHDHAATSHVLAEILGGAGLAVTVRGTFRQHFRDLPGFDLVVVNAGRGPSCPDLDGDDASWAGAHEAVRDYVAGGGALLGVHQAANTFGDSPHWAGLLGGRWVDGHSMHPPQDLAHFTPVGEHPVVAGLGTVVADDEQYCELVVEPGSRPFLVTEHEGREHPVAWAGPAGRVVYDALGHDVGSYASPSRVELLRREVDWLLRRP